VIGTRYIHSLKKESGGGGGLGEPKRGILEAGRAKALDFKTSSLGRNALIHILPHVVQREKRGGKSDKKRCPVKRYEWEKETPRR